MPDEYSAPERASRPDELSTVTAAIVQYIRRYCILCFCAFGAPGSARTRGLSLWVFQEGGRADAQGKRDATLKSPHQDSHRRSCCFPTLYYPLPGVTTPLWESPLRHLSIFNGAVTLLNPSGIGAQFGRFWCTREAVYSSCPLYTSIFGVLSVAELWRIKNLAD